MFVMSKTCGTKIYHHNWCRYEKRIRDCNKVYYPLEKEVREKGYKACNCCSEMSKQYREEKKEIDNFINKNDMTVRLDDNQLYIDTKEASWKIVVDSLEKRYVLYHENRVPFRNCIQKDGTIRRPYHLQGDVTANTIMEYIRYIHAHDKWKASTYDRYKQMPRDTKKQKKAYYKEKRKARKKAILRVCNLIEKLCYEQERKATI